MDHLPYWPEAPCNSITASEGKFFMEDTNIIFVDTFKICFFRLFELQKITEKSLNLRIWDKKNKKKEK